MSMSVIVEMRSGAGEAVLARLRLIPTLRIFGMTEKQIVAVIEGDDASVMASVQKELGVIEGVTGIYPSDMRAG